MDHADFFKQLLTFDSALLIAAALLLRGNRFIDVNVFWKRRNDVNQITRKQALKFGFAALLFMFGLSLTLIGGLAGLADVPLFGNDFTTVSWRQWLIAAMAAAFVGFVLTYLTAPSGVDKG